jgi:hypothetical protein
MKTIRVSPRSKKLNELLKIAQRRDLILQSKDGAQYVLARVTNMEAFYVGRSDDFDEEIAMTRKNKRLMKFLSERAAKAKSQKGIPLETVRKELGLE